MSVCVNVLAQAAPGAAVAPDRESDRRTPLPPKAGMFGIESTEEPTVKTTPGAPRVRSTEKPADNVTPDSPSNAELEKLIRAQTHAINLLFIEINSLKARIEKIDGKQH